MSTPDPRRNVPSASGMGRIINCPPSFQMEAQFPETENPDAASGTRIHAVLAGLAPFDSLTPAEQQTCEMCERDREKLLNEFSMNPNAIPIVEKRLGLTIFGQVIEVTPDSDADFIFTGQADLILVDGQRAIVIDYKSGRGDYADAVDNEQLASLAVLVAGWTGATEVRVSIVQPWLGMPTVADYKADGLHLAKSWLTTALEASAVAKPEDARAGDWCKHCKAKVACKAHNDMLNQSLEIVDPMRISSLAPKEQSQAMWSQLMQITPERHIAAYQGRVFHRRFVQAVESSFLARVEAGEIPGWEIKTKPGNREVTDAQKAFAALQPLGVTADDMLEASSVAIGSLEESLRKASGIKSQTEGRTSYNLTAKAAKESLNAALEAAGAIGRKADGKEIVKTGTELEEY